MLKTKSVDMTEDFHLNQNPSRWSHRFKLIAVAFCGFCISLYLGLYQLHVFPFVWDPIFGSGSVQVLHSSLSKELPIPDALIGAMSYFFDIAICLVGDEDRWQSKPYIGITLGIAAILFALSSLFLLIVQAFVVHAFCTLCVCSAVISFILVWPATAEMRASIQYRKFIKNHR